MKRKIILASTSPRRHKLASTMGLDFTVVPSSYEEDMTMKMSKENLVKILAEGKASDVAKKYKNEIVIGVDTIISFRGEVLGKPLSKKQAFDRLKSYSGKFLKVYSGVCLIDTKTGKKIKDYEVTKVKFRKLTNKEIEKYISTGEPMDKAGAFGIQGLSSIFIEKIDGCYFNVVGFPIHNIYKNLSKLGVDIFKHSAWR